MSGTSREKPGCSRSGVIRMVIGTAAAALAMGSTGAQAQDLVHHFLDPSFGGNPFYSDHLLAIAAIDRPAQPTTPTTTPTQEELLAQQLRAQLLSQLSGNILDQIQNAAVGDTGDFTFGNQQVSFTRTAAQTTVTFTNTTTGEVNTLVIPASNASASASAGTAAARIAASASPLLTQRVLDTGYTPFAANPIGAASGSGSAEQALLASSGTSGAGAVLPPY